MDILNIANLSWLVGVVVSRQMDIADFTIFIAQLLRPRNNVSIENELSAIVPAILTNAFHIDIKPPISSPTVGHHVRENKRV